MLVLNQPYNQLQGSNYPSEQQTERMVLDSISAELRLGEIIAFFDVMIFNPFAQSHCNTSLSQCY